MLLVDPRAGSRELIEPLKKRGLPVQESHLEFGDLAWVGNGPDGPLMVGVEFKSGGDLLRCIIDGRFADVQLPGLLSNYNEATLLYEGYFTVLEDGGLGLNTHQVTYGDKNGWQYRRLNHWLATVRHTGIFVDHTTTRAETLAWIHAEYTWWTSKEWEEHKSIRAKFTPPKVSKSAFIPACPPSRQQRVMMELCHGMGWEKAEAAARHFGSVKAAVNASAKEWEQVEGIGKVLAKRIVEEVEHGSHR